MSKETYNDSHTSAIAWSAEQVEPVHTRCLSFENESFLDFVKFERDERVVEVSASMVPGKDSLSLLVTSTVDEPTWGFRQEPLNLKGQDKIIGNEDFKTYDEENLDDGRETLES